ncbi:MAG TPA: hypothetical protein IAA66_07045 [Candidatus Avichristensenella intestinipullorum]|uniref:Carboxypeptidase regulatory-like domain-containing protein n=1 Tax=Candidatus Avichristensenella intestinipullorum TaxID=2840693 RepID=A0A9D0YWF5_9FIRM|nr:hypothetical protein [Candidatus Avichristensenella intestinipullorum]
MKKVVLVLWMLCLLCPLCAGAQDEEETVRRVPLPQIGAVAVVPAGWTVSTPDTSAEYMALYGDSDPDILRERLLAEGEYLTVFSPEGDVRLRLTAESGDETASLYWDIERYTSAMRTAIKEDFLDREAWSLTGYRFTEANWTNRDGQGRMLWLVYNVRRGDEIVARGRRAYTVRNGLILSLDIQVQGRRLTGEENDIFETFVADTVLPVSENMPLLPVGLTVDADTPEETHEAEVTVRGDTSAGALVSALLLSSDGDMLEAGETTASSSGSFRLDISLPAEDEWQLFLTASLEGYADSELARWLMYDSDRIPVTFTSYPVGEVYDKQPLLAGVTLPGVSIQCMEGEDNKQVRTGSDGSFSFKLDKAATGERTVTLALSKDGFADRRFNITFTRLWKMEDYADYLDDQVRALSYENLSTQPEKFTDRIVRYEGHVLDVSGTDLRTYVHVATRQTKDGGWTDALIAVAEDETVLLDAGDSIVLYGRVTGGTYQLQSPDAEDDHSLQSLPELELLAYLDL